jgi:hypothetical protein
MHTIHFQQANVVTPPLPATAGILVFRHIFHDLFFVIVTDENFHPYFDRVTRRISQEIRVVIIVGAVFCLVKQFPVIRNHGYNGPSTCHECQKKHQYTPTGPESSHGDLPVVQECRKLMHSKPGTSRRNKKTCFFIAAGFLITETPYRVSWLRHSFAHCAWDAFIKICRRKIHEESHQVLMRFTKRSTQDIS